MSAGKSRNSPSPVKATPVIVSRPCETIFNSRTKATTPQATSAAAKYRTGSTWLP